MQRDRGCAARARTLALAAVAALAAGPPAESAPGVEAAPAVGLQVQAGFDDYSPLSASAEITRRLLSPLTADAVQRALQQSHERLRDQSIDLAAEHFVLYVPPHAPSAGYALLVFIPPWDEAQLPRDWGPVLDRSGTIFVTFANSGNDADPLGRREPLALLAAYNVMQHYPVDPERVYVGGFSGGAHIAERLALAYPDLFRGALLNAGSDPLDAAPPSPPARELLERFQQSTRVVYVTGEHDELRLAMDRASEESMQSWCVFDVAADITHGASHEVASPRALARALEQLGAHVRRDPARLTACRAALDRRLAAQLARVQSLIDAGKRPEARKALEELDRRFGGLAAPQSLKFAAALE